MTERRSRRTFAATELPSRTGYAWEPKHLFVPEGIPADLRRLATSLDMATHEFARLLGIYELYDALSSPAFQDDIAETSCLFAVGTMRMSLIRNALLITVALFDEDQRSVHLRRIAMRVADSRRYKELEAAHIRSGSAEELDEDLKRLERRARRMKSGRFPVALSRLTAARNTTLAHYELENRADIPFRRDLQLCMVMAAGLADLANIILLMRSLNLPWTRSAAREQAFAVRDAIARGADTPAAPVGTKVAEVVSRSPAA